MRNVFGNGDIFILLPICQFHVYMHQNLMDMIRQIASDTEVGKIMCQRSTASICLRIDKPADAVALLGALPTCHGTHLADVAESIQRISFSKISNVLCDF
jgi:hypothetical protein